MDNLQESKSIECAPAHLTDAVLDEAIVEFGKLVELSREMLQALIMVRYLINLYVPAAKFDKRYDELDALISKAEAAL